MFHVKHLGKACGRPAAACFIWIIRENRGNGGGRLLLCFT